MAMWKQLPDSAPAGSVPDQMRRSAPAFQPYDAPAGPFKSPAEMGSSAEQTVITSGITVRGEITGPDAIYIDGVMEGEINIPGERVTVGPNGRVVSTSKAPCITAHEVVVLGTVTGNIVATDRLEIRANGSVTGDVRTARIRIEDGSFFQGAIDIRKAEPKLVEFVEDPTEEEPHHLALSHMEYEEATA